VSSRVRGERRDQVDELLPEGGKLRDGAFEVVLRDNIAPAPVFDEAVSNA
jgi:hypothetical protein